MQSKPFTAEDYLLDRNLNHRHMVYFSQFGQSVPKADAARELRSSGKYLYAECKNLDFT